MQTPTHGHSTRIHDPPDLTAARDQNPPPVQCACLHDRRVSSHTQQLRTVITMTIPHHPTHPPPPRALLIQRRAPSAWTRAAARLRTRHDCDGKHRAQFPAAAFCRAPHTTHTVACPSSAPERSPNAIALPLRSDGMPLHAEAEQHVPKDARRAEYAEEQSCNRSRRNLRTACARAAGWSGTSWCGWCRRCHP